MRDSQNECNYSRSSFGWPTSLEPGERLSQRISLLYDGRKKQTTRLLLPGHGYKYYLLALILIGCEIRLFDDDSREPGARFHMKWGRGAKVALSGPRIILWPISFVLLSFLIENIALSAR
jgi:hypothetical protein